MMARKNNNDEADELSGEEDALDDQDVVPVAKEGENQEESQGSSLFEGMSDWGNLDLPSDPPLAATTSSDIHAASHKSIATSATTTGNDGTQTSAGPSNGSATQELFKEFEDYDLPPATQKVDESILGKRKEDETDFSSTSTIVDCHPKKAKTDNDIKQVHLQPYKLAYDPALAREFAKKNVPVGAQFELARMVTAGTTTAGELLKQKASIARLTGTNREAVSAMDVITLSGSRHIKPVNAIVWDELDHEKDALSLDPYAGMGHDSDSRWYGGRVKFRAKFEDGKFVLQPPKLDASSALARRYGSWNFLQVDVEKLSEETAAFFLRPVIVWGMVFRALCAKSRKRGCHVVMVCTNEMYSDGKFKSTSSPRGVGYTLLQFVDFLNNMDVNSAQFIGKWASRIALYISSSTPGPRLEQDDIYEQPDIYNTLSKAGSANMTDGCGVSNWQLHAHFRRREHVMPTAIQFRLRGGKGMTLCVQANDWIGKPPSATDWTDATQRPLISMRHSQIKIKFPPERILDPLHTTMAVCSLAELRSPVRLSAEVIINLSSNGVPHKYFTDLARLSVKKVLEIFTEFDENNEEHLYRMWAEISSAMGVASLRKARQQGFYDRKQKRNDDSEEDDLERYPIDSSSGFPLSIAECAMELLDSGFLPSNCVFLRERLNKIAKSILDRQKESYQFDVEQGCSGIVVVDPFGVLKEDEIQIKASSAMFLDCRGLPAGEITGPVVMTRNPCKIPTDARKLIAKTYPELATLTDVIVCSIKGKKRLLDYLGGGDYDGDRCSVFWDEGIVSNFRNAPDRFMDPGKGFDAMFEKDTTSVKCFMQDTASLPDDLKTAAIQKYLLAPLESYNKVGTISDQHSHCIYVAGYDHPDTVMVGHVFGRVMDSSKTGERLIKLKGFINPRCNNPQLPPWDLKKHNQRNEKAMHGSEKKNGKISKEKKEVARSTNMTNRKPTERPAGLPKFVMDEILEVMDAEWKVATARCDTILAFEGEGHNDVAALVRPWGEVRQACRSLPGWQADIDVMQTHVTDVYDAWCATQGVKPEKKQDAYLACSRRFHEYPDLQYVLPGDRARILASCAVATTKSYRFPFNIAFRELCQLQARCGEAGYKPTARNFYERSKLRTTAVVVSA